jgi:hypothetical protein
MINVAIWTLTAGAPKATYTTSLMGMGIYFMNTPIAGFDGPRGFTYDLFIGSSIVAGREHAVESVLDAEDVTHLLFIDDDMGWKSDCLNIALSRDQPIVIANYRRKTSPFTFTARKQDGNQCVTSKSSSFMEEVAYGGFGFALIQRDVLRDLKAPRFLPHFIKKEDEVRGQYTTEDYPFYAACREQGYRVMVDHEVSKRVWHVGDFVYQWDKIPREPTPIEQLYDDEPDA